MDLLAQHDALSFFNEHGRAVQLDRYERCEQLDVLNFIPVNSSVLELGGRIGVVSCMINRLLKNKNQHLVVEPDSSVLSALEGNAQRADIKLRVFNGAVSKKQLYLNPRGLGTYTSSQNGQEINCKSLEELEKDFQIHFDVLVADCEGAFEDFIQENNLEQFRLILLEEDDPGRCNYRNCYTLLKKAGFSLLHSYYDECRRSVYARTSHLPYDILDARSPSPVALFGKLGYRTKKYYEHPQENVISAHADSTVVLDLRERCLIRPLIFPTAEVEPKLVFSVNGREIEKEETLTLEKGFCLLSIRSVESPNWAHTGWSIN